MTDETAQPTSNRQCKHVIPMPVLPCPWCEIERLRAALAGEIGLVQLLSARSELQPDRQRVLGNHRHVEALAVLGDWVPADETTSVTTEKNDG